MPGALTLDYVARCAGTQHEQLITTLHSIRYFQAREHSMGRSAMNSSGTAATSGGARYVLQPTFFDKMTSAVCSSPRTNTSSPWNRNSAGNLAA
jgi:hypothetical protein